MYLLASILTNIVIAKYKARSPIESTDSDDPTIKQEVGYDNKDLETIKIAKQKFYVFITLYIGCRINERTDVYLAGGLRMVNQKYYVFEGKTKNTFHPSVELDMRYMFTDKAYIEFSYEHVFQKKKQFSVKYKILDTEDTETIKMHHSENILKLDIGYKFYPLLVSIPVKVSVP